MRAICLLVLLLPVIVLAQVPMGTGLLFDDDAYNEIPVKAKNIGFHDPIAGITSVSLKSYVPEIRNQGILGTCVGWATTYYARTIMQAVATGVQNQAEITAFAYSPTFTYRNANDPNDKDCSGGAYATRALKALVEKGAPNYSLLPVSCVQDIPDDVVEQAKQNRIKDFNRLFVNSDANDSKIAAIKRALVNKNPVVIGFEVERSLFHARGVYEPDGLHNWI